jgi:glycosyltransferase involved in cell wall biosynthesis
MSKKITFLLPGSGKAISGGIKVIHEYANALAAIGHKVTLVYPMILLKEEIGQYKRYKPSLWYWKPRLTRNYRPDDWFSLNPKVLTKWVPYLHERYIPNSDVVVATAWQTAEWANEYPSAKGKKLYLIQGLETMYGPENRVVSTWKMPLKKIVISKWLKNFSTSLKETAIHIPNGLDFSVFNIDRAIENRDCKIVMLYHTGEWKGSKDGLEAIRRARLKLPKINVTLFGTSPRPLGLEHWIEYVQKPSREQLRIIYNDSAVCVAPSLSEGWGLVPCEAMMCGAAAILTDIGGHREFGFHLSTALLSPPSDVEALSNNLIKVLCDQDLRERLSRQGNAFIQNFTWERAARSFEEVILNNDIQNEKELPINSLLPISTTHSSFS